MRYLILALDGGGARMVLQWTLLKRLMAGCPDLLTRVDVFAGTSAGSILASALVTGLEHQVDHIMTKGVISQVFKRTPCHKLTSLNGMLKAKYENDGLRRLLEKYFADHTFSSLHRALFIPAFAVNSKHSTPLTKEVNVDQPADPVAALAARHEHIGDAHAPDDLRRRCDRWHAVFYHNLVDTTSTGNDELHDGPDGGDTRLVDAVMRSTAAPTYFPLESNCIDGGVIHNNPSLAVLTHLLALGIPAQDIFILSIGTGELPREMDVKDDASLGLLQWVEPLVDMLMDASQEAIGQSCFQILGSRFHRISPLLTREIALDSIASMDEMVRIGQETDLTPALEWLWQINT